MNDPAAIAAAVAGIIRSFKRDMDARLQAERNEHAETRKQIDELRKRSNADRARLRKIEQTLQDDTRAKVGTLEDENADLRKQLADLEDRMNRPALPAPEPLRAAE